MKKYVIFNNGGYLTQYGNRNNCYSGLHKARIFECTYQELKDWCYSQVESGYEILEVETDVISTKDSVTYTVKLKEK